MRGMLRASRRALKRRPDASASLDHAPRGAAGSTQRSRIVAPLIAQREVLGYLYADVDGAFGRSATPTATSSACSPARRRSRSTTRAGRRASSGRSPSAPPNCRRPTDSSSSAPRARDHQQHPAGHGRRARVPGHRRPGRRQAARGVRDRRHAASGGGTRAASQVHAIYCTSTACASHTHPRRSGASTGILRSAWPRGQYRADPGGAWIALHAGTDACSASSACRSSAATACSAASCSRITNARTRSARRGAAAVTVAASMASRSRTRACSTRRSGCSRRPKHDAELAMINSIQQGMAA